MRLSKLVIWNTLTVLCIGAAVRQGRVSRDEAQARRRRFLSAEIRQIPALLQTLSPPAAATATKYADIATMDLFSEDRNPNVIIEPPKAAEPKRMPPLPIIYGVLGLPSGTKGMMSEKVGVPSLTVQAGDTIGEFRIASLDTRNVTFVLEGTMISRRIEDLIDRSNGTVSLHVHSARVPSTGTLEPDRLPLEGADRSKLSCVPGDDSPAGTVVGRYEKNLERTALGPVCSWMRVL
jgi:hypothetical protein